MSKAIAKPVYRIPGPQQLQCFLQVNSKLFNITALERLCKFPSGTLRYVTAKGGVARTIREDHYREIKKVLLPKLCEFVLLMQLNEYGSENDV